MIPGMIVYVTPSLAVVILAAGKGTRMKSDLPKVLHAVAGRPLLQHVVDLARDLHPARVVVVVGHQAERVRRAMAHEPDLRFALQEPQLGTGHAVACALPELEDFAGPVVILSGDVPGLRTTTLRNLLQSHLQHGDALTVLGMELDDPGAYGRLITDAGGRLLRIVEYRDAGAEERAVRLVNAGVYVAQAGALRDYLPQLSNQNNQQEYYLTDLVQFMAQDGLRVGYALCPDPREVAGVNSPQELAQVEAYLASRPPA